MRARGRPFPSSPDGKEPFGTLPDDGITPAGYYKVPPKIVGLRQFKALLPGHDAHSQDTDTAGWDQYTPSGRTAVRQSWAQYYPGVDNFWPITQPNLARTRTARGGNQNVGGVAQYGDLASSGGDIAYEAPAPPALPRRSPGRARRRHDPAMGVLMAVNLFGHKVKPATAAALVGGSALAIWFAWKQHKVGVGRVPRRSTRLPACRTPRTTWWTR